MPSADALERPRRACPTVSVSLLAAGLMALGEAVRALEHAGADVVHFDVMDGRFGEATGAGGAPRRVVRGAALNPGTPLDVLDPLLEQVDVVFLLAVNPGFGGQRFIVPTLRRIERVKTIVTDARRPILVGLDGGVTRATMGDIARTGCVDIVVSGSAVFEDGKIAGNLHHFLDVLRASRGVG